MKAPGWMATKPLKLKDLRHMDGRKRHLTEEHKKKIGDSNRIALAGQRHSPSTEFKKGSPPPSHKSGCKCFRCTGISPMKGRKVPWGHKYAKGDNLGENNVNWKGGVTSESHKARKISKYKDWQIAVFKRDNFSCVVCHKPGRCLHAHHIKKFSEYPEGRYDVDNGITACEECHRLIHAKNNYFEDAFCHTSQN